MPDNILQKILRFPLTRIVLALVAVSLPIGLVQSLVKSLNPAENGSLIFTVLAIPAAFLAYWGYVRLVEGRPPSEIFIAGGAKELGAGMLLGCGLFSITIGLVWVFGGYQVVGTNTWNVLVASLTLSVMSGFLEELIARGIIFRITEESLGTWFALVISALIFGLLHLGNPHATIVSALAIALEAGLLLGACYIMTRRLWFAVGMHFAWNFTQGGIFGVAVSGMESKGILQSRLVGPEVISGGLFGAEASIIAVVVCVSGFAILIVRAHKQERILQPFWVRTKRPQDA